MLSVTTLDVGSSNAPSNCYRDRRFPWDYARVPVLGQLRYSSGLARGLRQAASGAQVIHNHGLWLMPNVQAGRIAAEAGKPLVVAPRGMLGPAALEFSRRKKLVFWHLLQGPVVRHSACIHATSEQEYQEIRAFGLKNPVAVIPNGIDLPVPPLSPLASDHRERTVLSLGRIHPKKGLDRLVRAWARLEVEYPGWRLRIIGPSELGYDKLLRDACGYPERPTALYRGACLWRLQARCHAHGRHLRSSDLKRELRDHGRGSSGGRNARHRDERIAMERT